MVRTDCKEQKLDAFVVPRSLQSPATQPTVDLSDRGSQREEEAGGEVGTTRTSVFMDTRVVMLREEKVGRGRWR